MRFTAVLHGLPVNIMGRSDVYFEYTAQNLKDAIYALRKAKARYYPTKRKYPPKSYILDEAGKKIRPPYRY